jgi:hypothetical protein
MIARSFFTLSQFRAVRLEAAEAGVKLAVDGDGGAAVRPFGEHEKTETKVDTAEKRRMTIKARRMSDVNNVMGFLCRIVTNGLLIKYDEFGRGSNGI